jgi:hypothetical protein
MQHRAVGRALEAISRYKVQPDQIDHAILSAINVSLCLETGGDARVADGFNEDIARNGRQFNRWLSAYGVRPEPGDEDSGGGTDVVDSRASVPSWQRVETAGWVIVDPAQHGMKPRAGRSSRRTARRPSPRRSG